MAETQIILTPKADEDIREIFDYLSEFSLNAADVQVGRILDKIELLKQFPRIGRVVEHFGNQRLRELPINPYVVAYYIVSDVRIDILSIHHSAKPPSLYYFKDEE
jgi:plasmid stabilization system protein ParE